MGRAKKQKDFTKRVEELESEVRMLARKIEKLEGNKPSRANSVFGLAASVLELAAAILAIVVLLM